uniref:hypothetical protein n=1 Tax=Salmonella enterica TaxID=28901 RepID=UPI00398C4544
VSRIARCRGWGLAYRGTRMCNAVEGGVSQIDHTLRGMLHLMVKVMCLGQRFYLIGCARDIINRIYHSCVVVGDSTVALRFGDIEVGILPSVLGNLLLPPACYSLLLSPVAHQTLLALLYLLVKRHSLQY